MARPLRFAVKVIARLKPPEMIGISIARVRRPSSGSWKAIEAKVVELEEAVGGQAEHDADERQQREQARNFRVDETARPPSMVPCQGLCGHCAIFRFMGVRQDPISRPTPSLDSVIATRMIAPMIILNA